MDTLIGPIVEDMKVELRIGARPPNRPYQYSTGWTDERVALLKKLYADGLTGSQIAAELGGGLTRNAVIGKVHRLGLKRRGRATIASGSRLMTTRKPRAQRRNPMGKAPKAPPKPLPADDPSIIPLAQRKTILDIENHHCHFPYGTPGRPDFFYCGGPGADVIAGRPYCEGHHGVAFMGIPDRRRPERQFNTNGMAGAAF